MEQVDLLVFAPHPDDESIACAGVMLAAHASGKRLRVVFFTNGEGYPQAAALQWQKPQSALNAADYLQLGWVRQNEALAALACLGLPASTAIFLAYPDGCLQQVYQAAGEVAVVSDKSLRQHTYALQVMDFHTQRHGHPALYRRQAVLEDICDLLTHLQPKAVYWPSSSDSHLDHQAAAWFVRDALQLTAFDGDSFQYLIHAETAQSWPLPRGVTPTQDFAASLALSPNLHWPPKFSQAVSLAENEKKLAAIHAYASQLRVTGEREYLQAFIKAQEVFW